MHEGLHLLCLLSSSVVARVRFGVANFSVLLGGRSGEKATLSVGSQGPEFEIEVQHWSVVSNASSVWKASWAVAQRRHFRGWLLISATMSCSSSSFTPARSVFLGR